MFELLAFEYRPLVQDLLAFTICGAALVFGGGPERAVAATWLIVFEIGSKLYAFIFEEGYQLLNVNVWFAGADLVVALTWITVALYANRNYTLFIAGLQLLAVLAHVARGLTELISPLSYAMMIAAPGWFQLLLLAVGLSRHIARRRRFGPYRDWRTSRPPAAKRADGELSMETGHWIAQGTAAWRDDLK